MGMSTGNPVLGLTGFIVGYYGGEKVYEFVDYIGKKIDDAFDEIGDYLYKKLNGIKKLVHYNADPLVLDLDGDGIINDGSELFGDSTLLTDGSRASSGFEALNQYDENNDGIINEKDAIFSSLKVWQDKNSDGVSQADEIYSMEDIGIESISLNLLEEDGRRVSEVSFVDGNISKIGEFDFESEK